MYDVIVVGARCAGAPTAMRLAAKGHRVLMMDRDDLPSDYAMSTHWVHTRGLVQLRDWGLLDHLELGNCASIDCATFRFGTIEVCAEVPEVEGLSLGFAPRRFVLDKALLEGALAAGVEFRDQCEVRGLIIEDGRVGGVRAETKTGTEFEEHATIVIGADGPASRVARAVGAREYHRKPALQGTIWGYFSDLPVRGFEFYQGVGEAVYAFPTSSATLVGVNVTQPGFKEASRNPQGRFESLIAALAPELAERMGAARLEEPLRRGATRNFFRAPVGPGWALVGDAGYKKDPCTAQGITDAFLDAEALAEAVHAGLSGRLPPGDALNEFHRARDVWALPFYELTCEMAQFAPLDEQQKRLYAALAQSPKDASAFFGLITEATSPRDFFSPSNLERIIGSGT